MSHQIDQSTGQAAVFVTAAQGPAWHRLGKTIVNAATSAQAIKLACLDWNVEQWPLTARDPLDHRDSKVPHHLANVRTDTQVVLGIVGRNYHPFQNREAFDFMDSLVGDKLAMFETAGALQGGRKVWMLARIPKEYRAGPDDLIKPYVLLVNSFDGSTALRMLPTTVRVVCMNTLNLALRESRNTQKASGVAEGIAIPHRPSLEERVKDARLKLGIIAARFDQFDEELHAMLAVDMNRRQVDRYFENQLPIHPEMTDRERQNRQEILTRFRINLDNERNTLPGVRGTAWAAYNAVSEWADHQRGFRGRNELVRQENQLQSIWFGSSHQLKQRAYQSALQLVR